ncbi:hypothetical protein BN140_3051 [Methanoculleus bourgensis MS2]|uniref:Uncharacterized protein n=1 Tax=Methanoculleus bourgensis (strain ATCC 43281 / DSM 3045 / OCM 15 / MS2) TaxID=1201294 RepID=W6PW34_METBM|nr:hypothetical protein BN140_3051 [Methanoculleus bourgensis MS2]
MACPAAVPPAGVEPHPESLLAAGGCPVYTFAPVCTSFAPRLHLSLHQNEPVIVLDFRICRQRLGIVATFAPGRISQAPGAGPPAPAGRLSVPGANGANDYSDQYLSLSIYLLWNNPHRPCQHLCLHFSRNSGANLVQRCKHDCGRISGPAPSTPFRKP